MRLIISYVFLFVVVFFTELLSLLRERYGTSLMNNRLIELREVDAAPSNVPRIGLLILQGITPYELFGENPSPPPSEVLIYFRALPLISGTTGA